MRRLWLLFSQAVTVAVAVLFVVSTLKPQWLERAESVAVPARLPAPTVTMAAAPDAPASTPATASPAAGVATPAAAGYSTAASRAAPAVVSIVASKAPRAAPGQTDPYWRFFFGDRPPQEQAQTGLGSGVIVSPEGYLLTNHHVVEDAEDIEVQLADGRSAAARLVGSDPETDLAVLRVALTDLPVLAFGDLRALRIGDIVLAIGNPFNVGQTVTSGIVSALGRSRLGLSTFENFIQTDAAINPGNSGGALVDLQGNLVGINTAIFSRTGGSLGIGFAIPADTAQQVLQALVRDGRVTRGWIGVEPRDLTPDLARNLGLPATDGVLIAGVLADGPAGRAGLRPGDVVVEVGGQPIGDTTQLLAAVAALPPDARAPLVLQRGAERVRVDVTVGRRPAPARRNGR